MWAWDTSTPLFHVRTTPYPYGMSEEDDVIVSCPVCGATADYDTPCPNGCDQLTMYLSDEVYKNVTTEDWDALSAITMTEVIELVKEWIEHGEDN